MANAFHNRFEKQPALWWIVVVIVGLNLWVDYYHRGWLILDAIILIFVIVIIAKWSRRQQNRTNNS